MLFVLITAAHVVHADAVNQTCARRTDVPVEDLFVEQVRGEIWSVRWRPSAPIGGVLWADVGNMDTTVASVRSPLVDAHIGEGLVSAMLEITVTEAAETVGRPTLPRCMRDRRTALTLVIVGTDVDLQTSRARSWSVDGVCRRPAPAAWVEGCQAGTFGGTLGATEAL